MKRLDAIDRIRAIENLKAQVEQRAIDEVPSTAEKTALKQEEQSVWGRITSFFRVR